MTVQAMSIPKLRDYQVAAINGVRASFQSPARHKRTILCVATGGGKTTIAAEFIRRTVDNGKKVLFVAHRKELVEQAKARLELFGIRPGVIMAGWKHNRKRPVNVASVQTLIRRQLPEADVIIVDECHHSVSESFKKVLDEYPNAFVIGLTATPYRTDGKGLGDVYTDIISPTSVADLIEREYLVPAKTFAPKIDLSGVKVTAGEYNTAELFDRYNKRELYAGTIDNYNRFAPGTKAIVFNVNVAHSQSVAQAFCDAGIPAMHVDGETPAFERARILNDFREGKFKVLCNVNILTEGFDLPAIETVILNRATKSKSLYLQMVGRGLRPSEGKKHCIVIDQGSNIYEHGPVDAEQELSLEGKKKDKRKDKLDASPVKQCPNCQMTVYMAARSCECGHVFMEAAVMNDEERPVADFEEVKIKIAVPQRLRKKWGEMTEQELKDFAELKGWKPGWVKHQMRLQQERRMTA
jgi:DNA repair protein RadD